MRWARIKWKGRDSLRKVVWKKRQRSRMIWVSISKHYIDHINQHHLYINRKPLRAVWSITITHTHTYQGNYQSIIYFIAFYLSIVNNMLLTKLIQGFIITQWRVTGTCSSLGLSWSLKRHETMELPTNEHNMHHSFSIAKALIFSRAKYLIASRFCSKNIWSCSPQKVTALFIGYLRGLINIVSAARQHIIRQNQELHIIRIAN